MQTLGAVFSLATLALGLVLTVRLLHLAVRTRKAPELAMGLYCLLVSSGGLLYGVAFRAGVGAEGATVRVLAAASTFCIGLGAFALAVGIWRIFRPGERRAAGLVALVGLWIGGGWLACVLSGRPVTLGDATATNAFFLAGRLTVYGVGAFEAFRYAGMLRKRVALGLADPVSAHQIRLWGIAWLCVASVGLGTVLVVHFVGREAFDTTLAPLVLSSLNAAAWVCTWLAFFPPAAYQRWVEGARAGEAA